MNTIRFAAALILVLHLSAPLQAQDRRLMPEYSLQLSGPYIHQNLGIFVVRQADVVNTKNILTLDEGLESGKVIVHESGEVSELQVENTSSVHSVFIQAGDIVKGGKQDRVLSYDLLLEPRSGRVPIGSFCVEQGRWRARKGESVKAFSESKHRLPSSSLAAAVMKDQNQGEVWAEVDQFQQKLSRKLGASVRDPRSGTSLQLSNESHIVRRGTSDYVRALRNTVHKHSDAVGFVYAVNGTFTGAEVYAGRDIFVRLWAKLLQAAATEAVAEAGPEPIWRLQEHEAQRFLSLGSNYNTSSRQLSGRMTVVSKEAPHVTLIEYQPHSLNRRWIHKTWIKNQLRPKPMPMPHYRRQGQFQDFFQGQGTTNRQVIPGGR